MTGLYRMFDERFDSMDKHLERISSLTDMLRATNMRLAGLEQDARQPRLATEIDVETDKKTRKRREDAGAADRAKHNGDSSSARRIDDGPTILTSFGKIADPPLAPGKCIGDVLVNKGAETPKPHLPPVEVRMLSSATVGPLPAGTVFISLRTIFSRSLFS